MGVNGRGIQRILYVDRNYSAGTPGDDNVRNIVRSLERRYDVVTHMCLDERVAARIRLEQPRNPFHSYTFQGEFCLEDGNGSKFSLIQVKTREIIFQMSANF